MTLEELLADLSRRLPAHPRATRFLAEARTHLEETQEDLVADGLAPDEAAREAARRFGDPEAATRPLIALIAEEERARRRLGLMVAAPVAAVAAVFAGLNFVGGLFGQASDLYRLTTLVGLLLAGLTVALVLHEVAGAPARRKAFRPALRAGAAGMALAGIAVAVFACMGCAMAGEVENYGLLSGLAAAAAALVVGGLAEYDRWRIGV